MSNSVNAKLVSYETVYILKPDMTEDSLLKLTDQYQGILVERGAKNIIIQNRGRRHLKYPIKKARDGIYIQMNYEANGELVSLIERSLKINEFVVRYLTVKV
jgi:small subunit ribosomal protein S6